MGKFLVSLVLFFASVAGWAGQALGGPSCKLSSYIDLDFYLKKSYTRIPKEIRSTPPGGNVKYENVWEVIGSDVQKLKVFDSDVDGILFQTYRRKIIGVFLHFNEDALRDGRVNFGEIFSSCGQRYDASCSELVSEEVSIRSQNEASLHVSVASINNAIYHESYDKKHPCH